MLTKENFNESHIRMLQKQSKKDPALLERAVFAFGLLEAIRRVEMPFIFKGGTCLCKGHAKRHRPKRGENTNYVQFDLNWPKLQEHM